jgi:hypothetical protein
MAVDDSFRQAGRAAGIHDVENIVGAHLHGLAAAFRTGLEQRRVVGVIGCRTVNHQHVIGSQVGQLGTHLIEHRRQRALRDQAVGPRVAQQTGETGGHQQGAERHQDGADRRHGPVDFEQFAAVRHDGRHAVALAHTKPGEQAGALADARLELAPGETFLLEDDSDLIRSKLRVVFDECR